MTCSNFLGRKKQTTNGRRLRRKETKESRKKRKGKERRREKKRDRMGLFMGKGQKNCEKIMKVLGLLAGRNTFLSHEAYNMLFILLAMV